MSHFTVLVVTNEKPTEEVLSKALAPYHEFECTGWNNEYVQLVDETEEVKKEFAEQEPGEYPTIQEFLKDYYGRGVIEEGKEPNIEGDHKYGYAVMRGDEMIACYDRTNPNAKWDWYVLGGRWRGMLKLKESAIGGKLIGRPGVFGDDGVKAGFADACQIQDLDVESLRKAGEEAAGKRWDEIHAIIKGRPIPSWGDIREANKDNMDRARELFWADPVMADLKASKLLGFFDNVEKYNVPRAQFVERGGLDSFSTYAVVKDGKWYEKGQMGWFGMSSNEKDPDEWLREYHKLLADLPPETWIAVVDCHI